MKYLLVTMSDGTVWKIPASVIADVRAKYYAKNDPDATYQEEFDYAMRDTYEITDWAANQMNWKDVEEHATIHRVSKVDNHREWLNAKKEVVDIPEDGQDRAAVIT